MASDVGIPDEVVELPTNALKRRQSEVVEEEEKEEKRRRTSSGKRPPTTEDKAGGAAPKITANPEQQHSQKPNPPSQTTGDNKPSRKRNAASDEKQRNKRLFGALLGNLNPPSDKATKRRGETEQRRKAELQKQDDGRLENRQQKLEKIAIQRKKTQIEVDEQSMRTRHKNLLSRANFLQTKTEPVLCYRPWDLLLAEEHRIDEQIKEAESQVARELLEWKIEKESRLKALKEAPGAGTVAQSTSEKSPHGHQTPMDNVKNTGEQPQSQPQPQDATSDADATAGAVASGTATAADNATVTENFPAVNANDLSEGASEKADLPGSDPAPGDPVGEPPGMAASENVEELGNEGAAPHHTKDEAEDEGDHVVVGDEDTVIY